MSLSGVEIPAVLGNWRLGKKLGSGFSGAIYRAEHVHSGKVVAVKIQHVDEECPTNRYERGFYPDLQGGVGMPTLWYTGVQGPLDYLVIDLLGVSLDNIYRQNGKKVMDLRSVCCIAIQMISRLEFMHSRGILHRDIQLGNAVLGLAPNDQTIYMIDFGFSKRYIDPYTKRHIPDNRQPRDFIGNYWFTSVNVHCRGRIPTRRDDLEATALMLIHILTPGGLHWTRNGVPRTEEEHDRLKIAKRGAKPEDLCRGMPSEFEEFLRYTRKLRFSELPNYEQWREEFRDLMLERGYSGDEAFIWPPPPPPTRGAAPPPARYTSAARKITPLADDVEHMLQDLAKLQLDSRRLTGDRKASQDHSRKSQDGSKKPSPAPSKIPKPTSTPTIEIPDSSEEESYPGAREKIPAANATRLPKAVQLRQVSVNISRATDNIALAHSVDEFLRVLKTTGARNLTKEGFTVLEALHKQLADPSVFAAPIRRTRSQANALENEVATPREAKATKLVTLRRSVMLAKSNRALADMVQEFGRVTDASNGRTITKDGMAFLEGLSTRLKALA